MPPIRTSTSSRPPVALYIPPSKPCGYIPSEKYDSILEVASTKAGRIQMRHAIVENITLQEPGYVLSIEMGRPYVCETTGMEYRASNPIRRTLRVPGTFTFHHLHEALQVAFEWASDGSYSFDLYGQETYGEEEHGEVEEVPIEELVEDSSWLNSDRLTSSKTRKLDQVFGPTMKKFATTPVSRVVYDYDCIHNHIITVLGADENFPHLVPECRS